MTGDNVDTGFEALGAEFTHLGHAFATADAALREPATGSDALGAFTVVLDAGGRVATVQASARWRDLIAAGQVGDSIVEAVQAAAVARLDHWSEVLDEQGDSPAPHPAAHVDLDALRADAPYVDIAGLLDELTSKLESVVAASTALMSGSNDRPQDRITSVAPDDADDADGETNYGTRPVTVQLDRSGGPERVDVSLRWLATVNRSRLGETVRDAFVRAYERVDAGRSSVTAPDPAEPAWSAGMTPQLQELIRNPAGVLASFAAQLP